jgi:hypothetical protein
MSPNATCTVITTTPTFRWSRAARTTTYEVRVYRGAELLVKKAGITKLTWTSSRALPRGVVLTWKVRGRKAGVNGAWSKSRAFEIAAPMAITAFSFQGLAPPVTGIIAEADHTIALTVPFGTSVTALVATFTTTEESVAVGATLQVSGVTPNDFSSPVTYTVIAADASTQDYTVTVTLAPEPVAIGDAYRGGKVAYILQPSDPGYDAIVQHGLIAATADQTALEGDGIQWATEPYWYILVKGTSPAFGTGSANTDKIIAQNGPGSTYAAGLARACTDGGYCDWYLPSLNELDKLYLNRVAIGGFDTTTHPYYWSSSEYRDIAATAYGRDFDTGFEFYGGSHANACRVRAVRSF